MQHRAHANYCVECDRPVPPNGARHRKLPWLICFQCLKDPPEKYRCGAPKTNGEPCRQIGHTNGRCHYHKSSQETSSKS